MMKNLNLSSRSLPGENMPEPTVSSENGDRRWSWLMLLVVLTLVAFIRIRLAPMPLERDEGEYALAGQFLLQGHMPSGFIYTMKLPGVPAVYAVIMAIFGQTATAIHLGLLGVNLMSVGIVLAIARRLFDGPGAFFSAAAFAVMSLSPSLLGLAAHATHFVALFVLAGCWLQLRGEESSSRFVTLASGIMFGLAFLMKQAALAFILFGAVALAMKELRVYPRVTRILASKLLLFFLGVIAPYAVVCLCVWSAGGFREFWFWTVQYAREYASRFTVVDGIQILLSTIGETIGSCIFLWLLGLAGLASMAWAAQGRRFRIPLLMLFLASFLAVCPGYYFRQHYFIVMLPALALLGGMSLLWFSQALEGENPKSAQRWLPALLAILALGYPFWAERTLFFRDTPSKACRRIYGANPFPESPVLAKFLADRTESSATIAVLGSEPQICFYAKRKPSTGYIYTYGLMELQPYAKRMQKSMIQEIENSRPQYLVFTRIQTSWLPQDGSDQTIFKWAQNYVQENFVLAGIVDIYSQEKTEYRWELELSGYQPKSPNLVLIYKRKVTVAPSS